MKRTLICLLVTFALATTAASAETPDGTAITVSGTGSVTLPPNLATVSASVETNAESADAAIAQNNSIYDRTVGALERLGIARSDIALSYYNVNYNPRPRTSPAPSDERFGYTVSRGFAVKVRRIADAGKVSDACLTSGATAISGVAFGLADAGSARQEATRKAVADARSNAEAIAAAAGLRVVAIKSLELTNAPAGPVPLMRAAAAGGATQFDQSNVNVTVNVNVVFTAAP